MQVEIHPSYLKYQYDFEASQEEWPHGRVAPDNQPFDRTDINDVLMVLEQVMEHLNTNFIVHLHRLEDMLHNALPADRQTRKQVFDWLIANF